MPLDIVAAQEALIGCNPKPETQPIDYANGVAQPEELSYDLAYRAHSGRSFVPDQRAKSAQEGYARDVNAFHEELLTMATNDAQRAIIAEEIQRYKANYLKHYGALLSASSRCISPMITGPANFPVRRNEKRMSTEDRRREEFLEWHQRARGAIIQRVNDARTVEEKQDADWESLRKQINRSLETIREIDEERSPFTRSAFVNSIVGKVERLAANGNFDLVARAILHVTEYNENHKKPAIAARNSFWNLGRVAESREQKITEQLVKEDQILYEHNGIRVVQSYQADRIQIFFPDKPSREMCDQLSGAGWRFSRSNGNAWQRMRTQNSVDSALRILPKVPNES